MPDQSRHRLLPQRRLRVREKPERSDQVELAASKRTIPGEVSLNDGRMPTLTSRNGKHARRDINADCGAHVRLEESKYPSRTACEVEKVYRPPIVPLPHDLLE